jgi:hypothetical protein
MEGCSALIARRSTKKTRKSHRQRNVPRGISVGVRIKLTCLMVSLLMALKVCWRHASRYVNLVSPEIAYTDRFQKVADYIHDVEDFGDLPPSLLLRLGQILSRRRAVTPKTLDLFLRPQYRSIDLFDCASKYLLLHNTRAILTLGRPRFG